ncbi:MAG: sigma 54-interacting transcriptional regulator, partial [Candidatus Latescibacteria bacterium]|nr:sigma 54-interacting transcriptional regulator [Candidatus Latescibacterota bacterium]
QGVCCYDGKGFTSLTLDSGTDQWRNLALAIHQDRQGGLWFVTFRGDLKRYDGQEVVTLHQGEGRRGHLHTARAVVEDPQGRLWFATSDLGLRCWDHGTLRTYTTADGLVADDVRTLGLDRQGQVWIVTGTGGVSRWDGQQFHTVTTGEGLGFAPGRVVLEDRQGRIWFATDGAGVSCWDGERFTRYTMAEGLVYDRVFAMMEDERGRLWLGTQGGGVSLFDGQVFQTLSTQDGLVNDVVQEILRTRQGKIWIATEGGITRYTPSTQAPGVRIKQIPVDHADPSGDRISVSSAQTQVSFEFQGRSFTSRPDRLVYRYMLEGHDVEWRVTRDNRAEYLNLPLGKYTFQVQAVDPDLNYSAPSSVRLEVVPDPKMEAFKEEANRLGAKGEFVGDSPAVKAVMEELRDVAVSDLTVLILGETGTGKGLAAQYVHSKSPRQSGPVITVNCGAIAQGLEESSLFGHEKGAFTGAVYQKIGWVGMAQGGTLFLDEVGELPPLVQVKLLRLLQEHEYERLGGSEVLVSNARIIAATNRDLEAMVREGTFRPDLYFRLNAYPVRLPPLRERKEDLPRLAAYFMKPVAAHLGKKIEPLSPKILKLLDAYHWPGNVRELQHVVERAVTACKGPEIQVGDIALGGSVKAEGDPHSQSGNDRVYLMEEIERRHIREVLKEVGWVIRGERGAAALLGLPESSLRDRMKRLGISRPGKATGG